MNARPNDGRDVRDLSDDAADIRAALIARYTFGAIGASNAADGFAYDAMTVALHDEAGPIGSAERVAFNLALTAAEGVLVALGLVNLARLAVAQ